MHAVDPGVGIATEDRSPYFLLAAKNALANAVSAARKTLQSASHTSSLVAP